MHSERCSAQSIFREYTDSCRRLGLAHRELAHLADRANGAARAYEIKGDELIITNRKPVTKKQYVLEPDPKKVKEMRDRFKNKNRPQKVPFEYQPN